MKYVRNVTGKRMSEMALAKAPDEGKTSAELSRSPQDNDIYDGQHSGFHATTVLAVLHKGTLAVGGDGQVTFQNTIMKNKATKIRTLRNKSVLAGFAGSTADALTLFDKFEEKLESYSGNLVRAAVEMAKDWRTDKYLRRLEALLVAGDKERLLTISGNGDVIEPDDGLAAIGSGGAYALAAARALVQHTDFDARRIVEESLKIAASICIHTNDCITIETL